jgi:hypothetical protein
LAAESRIACNGLDDASRSLGHEEFDRRPRFGILHDTELAGMTEL